MSAITKKIPVNLYRYITVLFLVVLSLRIVLITYYNSNYGGIEQNVVYGIQRVMMGQPLYQNPSDGTYAIMQYTPLYYYFAATISTFLNIHAIDVQSIYVVCRVLALLFNLLTVVIIALMIRSWRFSRLCAFGFAMALLIVLTSHYYTRGDSMHLFLFVAAIYSYILFSKTGRIQHILVAALFSAGSIMVKQSGILVCGILLFCLVFTERKYLVALFYSLCTIFFGYLIALICVNDGHTFYQNAYLGLKNGIDPSFLYTIFTNQFFLDMVPCYFLGGIITWLAIKRIKDKTFRIIATGAALSFLFAVTTGLKIGSSNNYFMEFLVFIIIAVPYLLQYEEGEIALFKLQGRIVDIRRFTYIAFIILITSKTVGFFSVVCIEKGIKNCKTEYANEQALYKYVTKKLALHEGEYIFFTDRQFFDNIFIQHAIMPTKDVISQTYAANHTTFDYTRFIAGMNTGMVKYIVTNASKKDINEWNKDIPFIHFDNHNFTLLTTYAGYSIYAWSSMPR